MPSMRTKQLSAVALMLLCSGCKRDAGVVKSAIEQVPASDGVVTALEPGKRGECLWRRIDVSSGTSAVVASLPGSCRGGRMAFSTNAGLAVVWFDPRTVQSAGLGGSDIGPPGYADETVDETASARLFLVTLSTGTVKPLPLPKFAIETLGLDAQGRVLALSLDLVNETDVIDGKTLVDGKPIAVDFPAEGLRALAHAWRFEGDGWKRVETAQTTTGWDYGLGVAALDASKTLGPHSTELLDTHAPDAELDDATTKRLTMVAPKGDGTWGSWGTAGSRLFAWLVTAELTYSTGFVVLEAAAMRPAPQLGFSAGELAAIRTRGRFGLVSSRQAGTHPRVYDLNQGTLVWSSDSARAVSFWP